MAQVWADESDQEEVLAMVSRTGEHTFVGKLQRFAMWLQLVDVCAAVHVYTIVGTVHMPITSAGSRPFVFLQ